MRLLTAPQIKNWDAATLRKQGIHSRELMERAARACTNWLISRYDNSTPFLVLCGCGNNGGDGLAITRFLTAAGYAAKAFILKHQPQLSADAGAQQQLLPLAHQEDLTAGSLITELPENVVILDAILGAGTSRPLSGWLKSFVAGINQLPQEKIAIDMPTGLSADTLPDPEDVVLQADHTLCLQQYKRILLHPEGGRYAGRLHLLDIGLDARFPESVDVPYQTIDSATITALFKPRKAFSHKGSLGMALIIGGSFHMIGAAALATTAAGRAGAGKVRTVVPRCGYDILQTLAPEALCLVSGSEHLEEMAAHTEGAAGIAVGPGMGSEPATVAAFRQLLAQQKKPLVLDADALHLLGREKVLWQHVPPLSILTPHPKEFERMFGETKDSMARLELAREKAKAHQVILVMKDRFTVIVTPSGDCWYNLRGSSAMATAGSGDVLSGILAGLLAQDYSPFAAALLGVHLHAVAGEFAAKENGVHATVAGDLVKNLGKAFLELE